MCELRCQTASKQDDHDDHTTDDDCLPRAGSLLSELRPVAASVLDMVLQCLGTELVVYEAAERDAVAEELGRGNWCAPDEDRGDDKKDVLEDAAEGEDKGGGLADLFNIVSNSVSRLGSGNSIPRARETRSGGTQYPRSQSC